MKLCKKIPIPTEEQAKATLAYMKWFRRGWGLKSEKNYYKCPKCGCYHLTSKPATNKYNI